jgi:type I restriction enzyme M protein
MNIVLPHGVLFRGGEEGTIRRQLIESNHMDAIIGLPPSIFFGTGIPTIILVLKQKRVKTDTLIVDASKGFVKDGKNNKLRASDIKRIADVVKNRSTVPKFSRVVEKEEIRRNEYNLNIPRYVDSSEPAEKWDIYASMFGGVPVNELDDLKKYWDALPGLREALFQNTTPVNASIKVEDIREAIETNTSVKGFVLQFSSAFADFEEYLNNRLLSSTDQLKVTKEIGVISAAIFERLQNVPLIDKYEAYQLFDDEWQTTKVDLEIIQTEGFNVTRVVEPNMVTKKKNGKDVEVQDGWKGRILPFVMVQEMFLADPLKAVTENENRLVSIAAELEELFDQFTEDEKEEETVNEAKTGFVNSIVVKEAKQIRADHKKEKTKVTDDYEKKILAVDTLITEEKKLKKQVKEEKAALHMRTKKTIENLTDEQVLTTLEHKWVKPVVNALDRLPKDTIDTLTRKLRHLTEKYATTYSEVAKDINKAENTLANLMDELTGNENDLKALAEFKDLLKSNL